MTTQPEALLLAERLLEIAKYSGSEYWDDLNDAAAELRRMHDLLGKANALCRIRAEEIERLKAQPEQEPVAWMKPHPKCDSACLYQCTKGFTQFPECATSPPASKPWVGLTQQDINIAFDDTQEGGGFDDFARAIEAKLREKNAPQQSKEDA